MSRSRHTELAAPAAASSAALSAALSIVDL
jgi:hypothetical protein